MGKHDTQIATRCPRIASEWIKLFFASGCFLGLIPVFPGSFGAIVGLAWHLGGFWVGLRGWFMMGWIVAGIAIFSGLHFWLTPWAQKFWNDADPSHFVLDEVVGYLCVPFFIDAANKYIDFSAGI